MGMQGLHGRVPFSAYAADWAATREIQHVTANDLDDMLIAWGLG